MCKVRCGTAFFEDMRALHASVLLVSILGLVVAACGSDPPATYPTAPTVTQPTQPPMTNTAPPTTTAPNIMGIPIPSGLPSNLTLPSNLPIPSALPGFPTAAPTQ